MANELTVGAARTPPDSGRLGNGVKAYTVTGVAANVTETVLIAAVTGSYHVVIGGYVSHDGAGAETLAISSGTVGSSTALATMYLGTTIEANVPLPKGLFSAVSEGLTLTKTGGASAIAMTIYVATITSGQHLPIWEI